MKTVAFTGYRPEKMPFAENDLAYKIFREKEIALIKKLVSAGFTHFITGMALGFDTWVAEDIIALRVNNSTIKLECAVPFPGQADNWTPIERERYQNILDNSDKTVMVSQKFTRGCYHKRNRYMVDNADVVICCYDGQKGGTGYTLNYAVKKNKVVIQLNPSTLQISTLSKIT